MPEGAPDLIAIEHDDHHAEHIGVLPDGRQFFLTTPFVPARGSEQGGEFVALYLFSADGNLLDARIESFGPRSTLDEALRRRTYGQWLTDLGDVSFERIEIAPFSVDRFGTSFGLIAQPPEEEDDQWTVTCEPGNYMAFYEPWDSGDYDT
ncbi:MAG: hypothetical protein DVB22_001069 [Verrucomicrobia bacterium]|jgi:hypothetical protein|nr:MAG: hypothetical protein DVB22_001069 [Verrucomicrobiota bacterium]